ncbi:pyridoxamine 5'-phosphate oxidase family protein [Rhodococcus kroppenstedtii]|uniref:pyridoxamine 5'-phosphate oxidase family protein n=1 Tax=Rhodococcoides kroppenstedtii TaxID=293050 RepID=UPI0029531065|nr:pyridoxamine 5'-phosphate oxidase family protein [Rhodococcus kroppenstedtii]MDV7199475.1 pyridoxamine 5'-phosphate oxidase family protein [Rhodococcus kroppenstedtii]
MGSRYPQLIFGEHARRRQGEAVRSGAWSVDGDPGPQDLTVRELALIRGAFQFHLGTVTPHGWPYVQYRSGPAGFLRHLGGRTLGFADHRGNQQYASVGNIESTGRVALYLADLPRRQRLKVFGTATVVDEADDPALLDRLRTLDDGSRVGATCERSILIEVEAFDWNCARSLVPQYTEDQVRRRVQPYIDEIAALQAEIARLREG